MHQRTCPNLTDRCPMNPCYYVKQHEGVFRFWLARTMMSWQRPAEHELCMTVLWYPTDWFLGRHKYVSQPTPNEASPHTLYVLYMNCDGRSEEKAFLEWLWAYQTSIVPPHPYINHHITAIGVRYCSFWKPGVYGQWLCMRPVIRTHISELLHPDGHAVPLHMKWFVHAWRNQPPVWNTETAVRN